MNRISTLFSSLILLGGLMLSCNNKKEWILDETFDSNSRGWLEESTSYHALEIDSGFYNIQSKDSSADRTSCISLDNSYLFALPEKYTISTSISMFSSKVDTIYSGLTLRSRSYDYDFRISNFGDAEVSQYNYGTNKRLFYNHIQKFESDTVLKTINIEIKIDKKNFDFIINGKSLGEGTMSAKSWEKIAPYAGKLTSIKVDYLSIK